MKILAVWTSFCDYLDGIKYAATTLGHECETFSPCEYIQYASKWRKNLGKIGLSKYVQSLSFEEYCSNEQKRLLSKIQSFKPDVVLVLNGSGSLKGISDKHMLRKINDYGSKTILWFVDSIQLFPDIDKEYLDLFDSIYSFDENDIHFIKNKYNIHSKYLPVGAIEEFYATNDIYTKAYDISFVGGADDKRLLILDKVAEYCIKNGKSLIAFSGFFSKKREKKFAQKYKYLYHFAQNKHLHPREVATIYKKSKINLNITLGKSNGLNPRTFEILAAGGFQLTDNGVSCSKIFKDKEHLVIYQDIDQLLDLIDYYLVAENERTYIAKSGETFVKNNYLLSHVLKEMFS